MAARLKGLGILGVVALLGLALASLSRTARAEEERIVVQDPLQGSIVVVVRERPGAGGWPHGPPVRVILARAAIDLDPAGRFIRMPGGPRLAAPADWPVLLVRPDGRLEGLELELERAQALGLRGRGFGEVRRALGILDPRLGDFWAR